MAIIGDGSLFTLSNDGLKVGTLEEETKASDLKILLISLSIHSELVVFC